MSERTPGPWSAHHMSARTWEIRGQDDMVVARTNAGTIHTRYAKSQPEIAANAHVLAASDELLDACEVALSYLNGTHTHVMPENVSQRLHDAIAKAKGTQ